MKAHLLAKTYTRLTAEERFRLILAAAGRGDQAEQDRLIQAGGCITLALCDHAPYAHAFDELGLLFFLELLEDAAVYTWALERWSIDARDLDDDPRADGDEHGAEAETTSGAAEEPDAKAGEGPTGALTRAQSIRSRYLDQAFAAGYLLRAKADGWKLFCKRLNVPPFLLWDMLPGFERLQSAFALTEKAAFVAEGFRRWLNKVRPRGEPELTAVPWTAESVANEIGVCGTPAGTNWPAFRWHHLAPRTVADSRRSSAGDRDVAPRPADPRRETTRPNRVPLHRSRREAVREATASEVGPPALGPIDPPQRGVPRRARTTDERDSGRQEVPGIRKPSFVCRITTRISCRAGCKDFLPRKVVQANRGVYQNGMGHTTRWLSGTPRSMWPKDVVR